MSAARQPCDHSCGEVGMNIFYIIGVVVVVAVILGYLGLA
jgi:hypothetical protein